jgi:serine/threonine protein kinase
MALAMCHLPYLPFSVFSSFRLRDLLTGCQLDRIEFIHTRDLVHRDIKPANFVMGTDKSAHLINVIDFGLAKKFRDVRTSEHIPYQQDEQHRVGTSLFASTHTHDGIGECLLQRTSLGRYLNLI